MMYVKQKLDQREFPTDFISEFLSTMYVVFHILQN